MRLFNQPGVIMPDRRFVFQFLFFSFRWPEGCEIPGPDCASDLSSPDLQPKKGEVFLSISTSSILGNLFSRRKVENLPKTRWSPIQHRWRHNCLGRLQRHPEASQRRLLRHPSFRSWLWTWLRLDDGRLAFPRSPIRGNRSPTNQLRAREPFSSLQWRFRSNETLSWRSPKSGHSSCKVPIRHHNWDTSLF